jgi:hypothetical protein
VSLLFVYFTLVCSAPSIALPYLFPPTPHIIEQLSEHNAVSSTCTDVMY